MKKVREQDVEEIIFLCYKEFIELLTEEEFEASIHMDINSVFIHLVDHRYFKNKDKKKKKMVKFAKQLKKDTFGKLKVTYMGAKKEGNTCISGMHIANAYEVEEENGDNEDNEGYQDYGDSWEE